MQNHIGSLYWVISHICNSECDHCYMCCGPRAASFTVDEAAAVIDNLPRRINHSIILSGGEVLHPRNRALLFFISGRLRARYNLPVYIQTNGDFLDASLIRDCLDHGIRHISIASMDAHHASRFGALKEKEAHMRALLKSGGLVEMKPTAGLSPDKVRRMALIKGVLRAAAPRLLEKPSFSIWGANEDLWLGGNWARGRSAESGQALLNAGHNFCGIWSGGLNFLKEGRPVQEIAVQLGYAYPCCPSTRMALGDLREDRLVSVLERAARHRVFRAIDRGKPWLGASEFGISAARARNRFKELGNVCMMCDELLALLDPDEFPASPFPVYPQNKTDAPYFTLPTYLHRSRTKL